MGALEMCESGRGMRRAGMKAKVKVRYRRRWAPLRSPESEGEYTRILEIERPKPMLCRLAKQMLLQLSDGVRRNRSQECTHSGAWKLAPAGAGVVVMATTPYSQLLMTLFVSALHETSVQKFGLKKISDPRTRRQRQNDHLPSNARRSGSC